MESFDGRSIYDSLIYRFIYQYAGGEGEEGFKVMEGEGTKYENKRGLGVCLYMIKSQIISYIINFTLLR